jgi:hypothetical protein
MNLHLAWREEAAKQTRTKPREAGGALEWKPTLQRCGGGPAPRPLPQLMLYLMSPQGRGAFGLVRGDLIWCPQRDSNPRCRLESAKFGIARHFPRSLVIG